MSSLFSNIQQTFSGTNNTNNNNNNSSALLQEQQTTQQQFNNALENSYSALVCGPSCQREKITKELEQKYLDAKTNLKTAPDQYEQSRRNYYIYSRGENEFNEMQEKELKEKAEKIANELTDLFNRELTNAYTMAAYLNTDASNSEYTVDLLEKLLVENKELAAQLEDSQTDIITNDRKTYYENEAIDNLELWYILFWRSFYFLYILLLIVLISAAKYGAAAASILLLLYPYYIPYLYKWVSSRITGLINKMPSNIYNNL